MLASANGNNIKFQQNRRLKMEEGTTCWQLEQMSHSYPPTPLPPFPSCYSHPCLTICSNNCSPFTPVFATHAEQVCL